MIRHTIITCLLLLAAGMAAGQKYPERRDIRSGNKFYGKAEYSEAEISYRKALEKQPDSYEANFNLADALYKQKRYDEAAGLNEQLAADSARLDNALRPISTRETPCSSSANCRKPSKRTKTRCG